MIAHSPSSPMVGNVGNENINIVEDNKQNESKLNEPGDYEVELSSIEV